MAVEDVPMPREVTPLPGQAETSAGTPDLGLQVCEWLLGAAVSVLPMVQGLQHQAGSERLTKLARTVLALQQLAEAAGVGLVTEAETRGVIAESTAGNATQWIARLAAGEPVAALLPQDGHAAQSGPLVPLDADDADADDVPVPTTESVAASESTGGDPVDDREGERDLAAPGAEVITASDSDGANRKPGAICRREPMVPGLEPAHAARIAKVALAAAEPRNQILSEAVASGAVGVPAAKTALEQVDKVMAVLPGATRDEVFGHFLALPPGSGGRAIRELTRRVIATYADEEHVKDEEDRMEATESVTWSELPTGLTRFVAELGPAHAAQLIHALNALSAPASPNSCCDSVFHRHSGDSTGERDERSPGKRHADALMELVNRAAELIDGDGEASSSGQVRLGVTVDYDVLAGKLRGYGHTEQGTALTPTVIRRLACDADILPMVLGSEGQPLDVGRRYRLVTPAIRAAVVERDRHCTFPGCGRPPSWCRVHHNVHWVDGGKTSLANSALLCPRHHTVVHRDDLVATITDTEVTWQPGEGAGRAAA